jgi:hypothetical protein
MTKTGFTKATFTCKNMGRKRRLISIAVRRDKWEIKKAYDLCVRPEKDFQTRGAAMAYNFQQELMTKEVSAKRDEIMVPGKPFRALLLTEISQNYTARCCH